MLKNSLLALLLALSAQASPWADLFKAHPNWQAAQTVTPQEKKLIIAHGHAPNVFTNASDPKKSGYLQTTKQFGDCTVEAEFIIPKGSNSGIYLMGRYEIQILDSHGKSKPGSGDMGGIYHRWDNKKEPKGYEGHPPLINAAKPAGEWQKLTIKFRAPRFASDGSLTEKPMFILVELNEKIIQSKISLNGHTRAAQRKGFVVKDHIYIQGDHGPIAFRKFKITPENFDKIP